MDVTLQNIRKTAQLITLPEIYIQLKSLLDDPDFTMAEVALLVGRDPGMAARFLQIVNSPLNRRTTKIESVSHAVSLLGSRQIHDIVLSASIAEAFDGMLINVMNMKEFWQRSVYCAVTARQLGLACGGVESDRLFLIGLLHDIGHLVMYLEVPEKAQQAIMTAKEQQQPLFLIEREQLGFDYAKLAGLMMKEWGLPKSLQIPVTFQTEPENVRRFEQETFLLHLASQLVQADQAAGVFGEGSYSVAPAAWAATGLTLAQCQTVQQLAAEQFGAVAECIF